MELYTIDPLMDKRWEDLVCRHPRASIFHQRGWLEALSSTYGYEPFVLTSASPGRPLTDGIALCRISSWITGRRSVSLPFADHCQPLLNRTEDGREFVNWLRAECDRERWKYIELRPLSWDANSSDPMDHTRSYYLHTLDLAPPLEKIFARFHKDSIQRKIRRAEREGLTYQNGRADQHVDEFYRLLSVTRRRQQLVPQPRTWFQNLIERLGDRIQIRLARKNGVAIAAMLTLKHGSLVVYKYGCSDARFHNLGGMPLLFWRLIEESKAWGAMEIDFGRSDLDNGGLITFKDRFGTDRKLLRYFRYSPGGIGKRSSVWESRAIRQIVSILPIGVLGSAGRFLYKHMG
jgi:hypothetical protein